MAHHRKVGKLANEAAQGWGRARRAVRGEKSYANSTFDNLLGGGGKKKAWTGDPRRGKLKRVKIIGIVRVSKGLKRGTGRRRIGVGSPQLGLLRCLRPRRKR